MQYINQEQADHLFEVIEQALRTEGLSEKERIPKYRAILEALFRMLASDEKRQLDGLYARMVYIITEYNVPQRINDLAHHLRIYANDVVHQLDLQPTPADDARCLYALAAVIAHFSRADVPAFIRKSYEHFQADIERALNKPKPKKDLPEYAFRAVVRDVQTDPPGPKHCAVLCDTDELGAITIRFWDNRNDSGFGSDLSGVHAFLQPFSNIYITAVKPYANRPGEYYATDRSLIVLEPDYLIEAKELAECCQAKGDNPLLHLLNRFTKGEMTDKMMLGNIAGALLDDLIAEPRFAYKNSFEKVMRTNSFGMLCMAHQDGMYRRDAIKAVYENGAEFEAGIRYALSAFEGKQKVLEPTFISDKYGLQGRLDLLLEDPQNPDRKDIVEMKSGKFHNTGLFPNHEAQALAYSLLLESTFPNRHGLSAILYAKAKPAEEPLRAVRDDSHLRKQQLLLLRNQVVANELRLAAGDAALLQSLHPDTIGPLPPFKETDAQAFHTALQTAPPLLKAWFLGFAQFVFREMQTGKTGNPNNPDDPGGFSALWRATKGEKVDSYNTLTYLRLRKNSITDDFHLTLDINTDLFANSLTNFRDGEVAILYPTPDPENPNPLGQQILKCTILSLGPREVAVSLANKQLDKAFFKRHSYWAIERDFRESGYRAMLNLLYRFLLATPEQQARVLGLQRPAFAAASGAPGSKNGNGAAPALNPNQQELVERALAARDYFLIQGPPGTGKTSTVLRELVRRIAAEEQRNLMVIAFTNQAVSVICEKLTALGIPFIRLGRGSEPWCWQQLSNKLNLDKLYEHVAATRVFVSTQATFANSLELLHFKQFHTLLIDEASQLLEPQLAGILPRFERFIMIGDDNQLPAVVLQDEDASRAAAPELADIGLLNFRESLFARLLRNARRRGWTDCFGMLQYHYRMHADIAEYPNQHYYGGQLRPGLPEQTAPLAWPHNDHPLHPLFTRRVAFVPTRRDPRPKVNEQEAELAAQLIAYVHQLYGDRINPETTVGVITPFRAQIAAIRQKLPERYQTVTIDTVERFQGSERDVIILSFAVKSPLQLRAIQSVNAEGVDRKLNVMLTRAREHLVVLGCGEVVGRLFVALAKPLLAGIEMD